MLLFILLSFTFAFAQQETTFSRIVIDAKTQSPLENVEVSIPNSSITQLTNTNGKFELHSAIKGEQLLLLRSQRYKDLLLKINSNRKQTVNLGILQLEDNFSDDVPATLITLLDSDLSDDNSSSEMTSGLLQSSKDVFMQTSAFNWGQARFRVRGLDSENGTMMLNGMVFKVDSPLNALEVYISTNFDGSNVTRAKWTKLEANLPSLSTSTRQFIISGGIDLSAYSGNIPIAFKYIGSGKDKTLNEAFMVDDVKIFGEK